MPEGLDDTAARTGDHRFYDVLLELADLHQRKSSDYGTDDDPLANYRSSYDWGLPPWIGVMQRVDDKRNRLITYAATGALANETVRDSFIDIVAHTINALLLWEDDEEIAIELLEPEDGIDDD